MRLLLRLPLSICLILAQTGCATIVSGTHEDLDIRSLPPQASVRIDGRPVGETPLSIEVGRGDEHEVAFHKQGYLDDVRMTRKAFNWWFAGNILFGGIVGIIIDMMGGAAYKVDPNPIDVTLIEAPQTSPAVPAAEAQ
ncbi:MAG: PEGA domain-containing protein [Deltaproteobacteria bacterium]|nr:PEGA domain-containing protein [Deltaproteobacteria bacterium]